MRGVFSILLYYLTWQRLMAWIAGIGLALMLLSVPAMLVNSMLARSVLLLGYVSCLAFPYFFTPLVLRELISNQHLALAPGFQLRAGIALFLLTVLLAVTMPFLPSSDGAGSLTPWRAMTFFTGLSIYAGIWQRILASRHAIPLTVAFFVFPFLLLMQYKAMIGAVFLDHRFLATAFTISVLGWMYGLVVLSRRHFFRPLIQSSLTADEKDLSMAQFSPDKGMPSWFISGSAGTAAGTLLAGYPDGMSNRMKWAACMTVIFPLACCLFLWIMWQIEAPPHPVTLTRIFILLSLLFSIMACLNYGELAARGRLAWLRCGGDRLSLWRFMERYLLATHGLYIVITAVTGISILLATGIPGMHVLYYLNMVIFGGLYCCYLSLACRIHNWSNLATAIAIIISLSFLLVSSMVVLLGREYYTGVLVSNPVVFASIPTALLILAILLRAFARRGFTAIDWYLVKISPIHRPRRARDGITVTG